MEKFKNYLIIGLFAVLGIVLLLKQCSSPIQPKISYIKGKEVIKYDTIKAPYKIVEFKTKYYPKVDTLYRADTVWDEKLCQYERIYKDSLSNDSITIYSDIHTIGLLKSNKTSYRWKVPTVTKTSTRTDTLVKPNKFNFYLNTTIGGNTTQFNIYPGATFTYKNVELGYNYGLLDKTHNIRIGLRLFKSRK